MKLDIFEKSMLSKSFKDTLKLFDFETLDKLNETELNLKFWELQNKIDLLGFECETVEAMTFIQHKILTLQEENNFEKSI